MVIFDSIKKFTPSGSGFSLENKKIRCLQSCNLSQEIYIRPGNHQIKIFGKKNSGNGIFEVEISDNNSIIFEKKVIFQSATNSNLIYDFSITKPGIYFLKIKRKHDSIGTISIDMIRMVLLNNLAEEKSFVQDSSPKNKEELFIIYDLNLDHDSIFDFISNKKVDNYKIKLLSLYNEKYKDKLFGNILDHRVFISIENIIDFINISNPSLITIFSNDENFIDIKNKVNIKYINSAIKNKNNIKKNIFNFDGILL
jgi:hypothetical protein